MTRREFTAWTAHTGRSRLGWLLDELTLDNRGDHLLYRGGASGTYVLIKGATVEVGDYEDAVPHIGEALFRRKGTKVFPSADLAFAGVVEALGLSATMALLTGDGVLS